MSFEVIKNFENKIAEFFGAPYAVAVDCCTHGIELCLLYQNLSYISVPKRTYISIPFLAAAKLHAGGGINTHLTTPIANVDMVTELLGGDLLNADPSVLDQNLEDYLTNEDNYVESTGVHVQAAFQFKLLMIDTFLVYRYTIADDVVPGSSGFGSVNVRLGMGF